MEGVDIFDMRPLDSSRKGTKSLRRDAGTAQAVLNNERDLEWG